MHRKIFILAAVMICVLTACITGITARTDAKDIGTYTWVDFPYRTSSEDVWEYLYVVGGYHSVDNGCPAWGTSNVSDIRFIGDSMGDLVITYTDGSSNTVPLIFGYTMWFHNNWQEPSMPFKGAAADKTLSDLLKSSLRLLGAYEGEETCVFRVKLESKAIKNIQIIDNPDKNGEPVFQGAFLTAGDAGTLNRGKFTFNTGDDFFAGHTIDSAEGYPDTVKNALDSVNRALLTYESDYTSAPVFRYPSDYTGSRVYFTGTSLAEIAGGVVYYNLANLIERTDADGFLHTSYDGAPSWRYDGFGYWVENANSYYDSFYSRDGGRGILSMLQYGHTETAAKAATFANDFMMYFPENNITFMGEKVPGHYTVVVNQPLLYSTVLVPSAGWPTQYTESRFGADYRNLGNQETDGHGLMMLANYNVWKNQGASAEWVEDNWKYIREAADWILWCFDHPDLSFTKNGLLYAESEAGMMKYTLYCNMACYLGLCGYAEMAEAAGKTEEAVLWKACADDLHEAISKRLASKDAWISSLSGFFHDPAVTMMSDFYGFDTADMDPAWVMYSRNTYEKDIESAAAGGYFGASGIGYDHSMITQNALLLDQMSDASKLMENLSKLSYAPRLDSPYLVPEGISVDADAGIIRRQGDLGNLVQLAEALKCYAIAIGVSPVQNNTLKLMPRLPVSWNLDIQGYSINNASGSVDMLVSYPKNGVQTAQITLHETSGFDTVCFRFGPLPSDTTCAAAQINGVNIPCELAASGDSVWAWVSYAAAGENMDTLQQLALIYGDSIENLPEWPAEWGAAISGAPSAADTGSGIIAITACIAAAGAAAVIIVIVIIYKKRNRKGV